MKIKFLGTAAYEGVPSIFCNCKTCMDSLRLKGRNIRSRSQTLINDDLLIDFPPDTVRHYQDGSFDINKIKYLLISHSHSDHFYPEDLPIILPRYSNIHQSHIDIFTGKATYLQLQKIMEDKKINTLAINQLNENDVVKFASYTVKAVRAKHDINSSPFIFIIQDGNKKILYAHDTGYFEEDMIDALEEFKPFDLVSFDCTCALKKDIKDHHLSIDVIVEIVDILMERAIINHSTIKVLNHFSHNGKATYDELVDIVKDEYIVSYDGLIIDL